MIIRKLDKNETYKADLASAVAFESAFDLQKEREEAIRAASEAAENHSDEDGSDAKPKKHDTPLPSDEYATDTWGAFLDDGETIMSSMLSLPFSVNFDGYTLLMRGIGGVATLPPYRRQGAVRECMRAAFADMRKDGFALTHLYPFSTRFYRQFGYGCAGRVKTWEVNIGGLRRDESVGGRIKMLFPGDDYSALDYVYAETAKRYNLSAKRHVFDRHLAEANTLGERKYIYVWENDAGVPRGFIISRKNDGVMDCVNDFGPRGSMFFLDCEAFTGLMNFVTTFASNYRAVRFSMPSDVRVDRMVPENTELSCEEYHNGMVRVVDVRQILEICKCRGNGALSIGVHDAMADWNEGVWRIEWDESGRRVVTKPDAGADIEMDVSDFSPLILGASHADDLKWLPGVKVHNAEAPAAGVFYRKPCMIWDLF